jgi:thymidylate synthase (FAD)
MAYIARNSSPHQENPEYARLMKYCVNHQHWSVFEHAHMTVEITTSRMISAQILRHRSFTFSEFSQRYAEVADYVRVKARRQSEKNRQSSVDDLEEIVQHRWDNIQKSIWTVAQATYQEALAQGIAKEVARAVLPMNSKTRIYMTGSVRSWIHYLKQRLDPSTQKEHREVAQQVLTIMRGVAPITMEAFFSA